jgi:hypothetical protein
VYGCHLAAVSKSQFLNDGERSMRVEFTLKPRTIGLILAIISAYLAVQSIFGEYMQATVLNTKLDSIPALLLDDFSVNAESTIPSWYSAAILLIAGALLGLIAIAKYRSHAPYRSYWLVLAIIFVYLSIDEGAAVHEIFSDPVHNALHTSGFLEFGWQLAVAPLLMIFGLLYLRFILHLPPRIRTLMIVSGLIYVGGAFLGDAVQANQLSLEGGAQLSLLYLAIGTVEELMEMLGIALFIYTLLVYMTELQYSYAFSLPNRANSALQVPAPDLLATSVMAAKHSARKPMRLVLVLMALVALSNAVVMYWGITQPVAAPLIDSDTTVPVYQAIVSQYTMDQVTVTHLNGTFNRENQNALQLTLSLLNTFSQVMVVSLPAEQSSIVLAGNTLPFDSDALASLLRAHGQTQFIIYEGPAISAILGISPSQ